MGPQRPGRITRLCHVAGGNGRRRAAAWPRSSSRRVSGRPSWIRIAADAANDHTGSFSFDGLARQAPLAAASSSTICANRLPLWPHPESRLKGRADRLVPADVEPGAGAPLRDGRTLPPASLAGGARGQAGGQRAGCSRAAQITRPVATKARTRIGMGGFRGYGRSSNQPASRTPGVFRATSARRRGAQRRSGRPPRVRGGQRSAGAPFASGDGPSKPEDADHRAAFGSDRSARP